MVPTLHSPWADSAAQEAAVIPGAGWWIVRRRVCTAGHGSVLTIQESAQVQAASGRILLVYRGLRRGIVDHHARDNNSMNNSGAHCATWSHVHVVL